MSSCHGAMRPLPEEISARLKELEAAGVVQRALLARPANGVTYELTDRGRRLGTALAELGRWGGELLGPEPRPGDMISAATMIRALEVSFVAADPLRQPETTTLVGPHWVIDVRIGEGRLTASRRTGPAESPPGGDGSDLVVDLGLTFGALIGGDTAIDDALTDGRIRILNGTRDALARFLRAFRPVPISGLI
jgi:HxlR-like helix-turn-helix